MYSDLVVLCSSKHSIWLVHFAGDTHMTKRKLISDKINIYLEEILKEAEKDGNIDYFKFEVQNHNGTLQMDIQFRNREKAY